MPLMTEAISREDFERMEKGLRPLKRKVIPRPDPEKPVIENEIKFDNIPPDRFKDLESAKRNTLKNKDGVRFIGYDVEISFEIKRSPGKPPGAITNEERDFPKSMKGWMDEGNFHSLIRTFRKQINPQVIHW